MDWNSILSQNTYHTVTVLGIGESQECHRSRKIFTDLHTGPAHHALLSTHVQNIKNDSHSAPLWSAFLTFRNYWVERLQFRPTKTHPYVRKPLNSLHSTHLNIVPTHNVQKLCISYVSTQNNLLPLSEITAYLTLRHINTIFSVRKLFICLYSSIKVVKTLKNTQVCS